MAKGKKQEDPNKVAQRKAERVAFVKNNPQLAPEVARQRFYVQTRANELEAAGKDVDRAALRAKFQSGGVTREGFYTPGDISRFSASRNTDSLSDAKNTPTVTPTPPVSPVAPSATNVPTPVKPKTNTTTSGVKTPPTSYQAPQVTTSLGQVVTPPTSYQAPRKGTPARGGEPGRGVKPPTIVRPQGTPVPGGEPRPPVWESGEPVIGDVTSGGRVTSNGIVYKQPGVNEGREFTAAVNRVFPQAPANPKALRQQQQARWQRVDAPRIQAEMNRNNPLRAAQQAKIDAGFVEAPYDWTNLYKVTAGSLTLAAEIAGTRFGGPVGGALATGTAFNLTERLGNLLEQKGALGGTPGDPGRFEGKTDLKSAAIIGGASLAGNLVGTGAQKLIPKIKPAWQALQKWADDTPATPTTPWKEGGASSPGIATSVTPRTPWREGPITGGTKSPRRVNTPKPTAETPTPTRVDLPGETQRPSGIIVPAPSNRTPASERNPVLQDALNKVLGKEAPQPQVSLVDGSRSGRTAAENATLNEMAATNYNAFDEVTGKSAAQPPMSLDDSKASIEAQLAEDGVKPYDQMTPQEKRKFTIAQKKALQQQQQVEVKTPEPTDLGDEFGVVRFGPSNMSEPSTVPEPRVVDPADPEYAKLFDDKGERIFLKYENKPVQMLDEIVEKTELGVVQGEAPDRLEQMRRHPAFTSKLPEAPPSLSVVKSDLLEYSTEAPTYPRGVENARLLNEQTNLDKSLSDLVNSPEGTPLMGVMKINPRTWEEDRVLDLGEGSIDNPIETKLVGEGDLPVRATTKTPPRQRANETAEAYGKRLKRWQVENSNEVFKAPAGFEQPRGTTSFREGAMERIEGGMSRTRRSVAFIDDGSGMSPEGFPVQMEGEDWMDFNKRSAAWMKSKGKEALSQPDNSYLSEGTPEPLSLAGSKETTATGGIPPKPKGLGRNAFYDAEKGEWVAGVLDKKSGKIVAKGERTVYATEEERIAGKKAYEAQRNADRKARRAANRAVKETELKAAATPVDSNAEFGPFMFGGEPIGRSRVVLEPGQVPDWAQQNIPLTGEAKPLSAVEDAWLGKEMTPEENAFFRELGNAKKASAGKRVVRSTRKPTPEEVKEYVARFRGLRGETGRAQGATNVAIDDAQRTLEKEIEQVLGTDAMVALKNTAIRGNTPPLTQNIDAGLQNLADVKATARTSGPLINYLDPAKPLPAATGRLREQAAQFFNAEGRLKGMTGKGRIRAWQRLTQSDWFRQLSVNEPSFANFLIDQNRELGEAFSEGVSQQVGQLAKPGLRKAKPMRAMGVEEEEKFIAGQLAAEQTDDGLGSYGLRFGDTPEEGLRARDSGITVSQRSQAAQIEAGLIRRARQLRLLRAEDQAAFGDIQYLNRGFERGQQLDPMIDTNVTKGYGIVDEKGFTNINAAEFRYARRQLDSPYANSGTEEAAEAIELKRKEVVARWRAKEITKEQMNAELLEFRSQLFDAPSTGLLSNPFAQEFATELPKGYVRPPVDDSYITRLRKEAEQSAADAAKQAELRMEGEQEWNRRHPAFEGGDSWMDEAKARSLASRTAKPEQTPMFDRFGPVRSEASIREEVQRLAALERKAERARAAAPRGKTAEEIRFEIKNPVFGPPKPWDFDAIQEINMRAKSRKWDTQSLLDEESRVDQDIIQEMFGDYEMDLSDFFGLGDN